MSRVDDLIAAGFQQTSRRFRMLARMPAGMTGLQALATVDPNLAARLQQHAEETAAEHYRRVYAPPADQVTLTPAEFDEFLVKTGRRVVPSLVEEARKAVAALEEEPNT